MSHKHESLEENKEAFWEISKWLFIAFIALGAIYFANKACKVVDHTTDVESSFAEYHEFQEIYQSCAQVNLDLGVIRRTPDTDRMFDQFSKGAILASKQQKLNRLVEDYNARSKMWDKALWKGKELPYQLSTADFVNY